MMAVPTQAIISISVADNTSAINNITMVDNMAAHGVIDKDAIDNQAKDNIVKVKNV